MQGFAVKAGVQIARGQDVLFMDADGATKISDVEKLEAELRRIQSGKLPEFVQAMQKIREKRQSMLSATVCACIKSSLS